MEWCKVLITVAVLLLMAQPSSPSKVLGVFPFASKSHWAVGSSVLKVLAEAGHEVTVISPYILQNSLTTTIKTIQLPEVEELFKNFPVRSHINTWRRKLPFFSPLQITTPAKVMIPTVMENEEVQALLSDVSNNFDLVIVESFGTDLFYGFGEHFNAPVIGVFPTLPTEMINTAVGNPEDPAYVPNLFLSYPQNMTLHQRVNNYIMSAVQFVIRECISLPTQEKFYKKYFPKSQKSLRQVITEDVAMAFVNTHFSLSFPRPYVPNMIEIGGINIDRSVGELPSEFKDFLDSATEGVVLFSMGSFLQASDFSVEQRKEIISALGKLKQKVIWRYNLLDADHLPKNILTKEWLPQNKILSHPNVKLFITHGGMLGTTESIYHGKPMIGIPAFGDQHVNIARAVSRGYALKLDLKDITESALLSAIGEILNNPAYSEQAQGISKIYKDQPMTPQELVLYWSEYVIRHNGAKHMQVESQNLGFFAYHGLDVLMILWVLCILPNYFIGKWFMRRFCKPAEKLKAS